ncbi:hypothetical protein SLS56_002752 [Neofusicoccum ribis]|uniref:Heterokaryon incompatibility domain-containing protein n=1 Tax=Neofusicoccum ribis TaxID=45134 RepID=A0ABR3T227_9PEZI
MRIVSSTFYTTTRSEDDTSGTTGAIVEIVGPPARATALRQTLSTLQNPRVDFKKLKSWIHECSHGHFECRAGDAEQQRLAIGSIPGMRLIDTTTRSIFRIEKARTYKYAALSYVWGQRESPAAEHGAGALPSRLPRTIEDALEATRRLGVRYLWVDRYCIRQCIPEEKAAQVALMHAIFRNAWVTLIAAAGDGPDHGLPGVGATPRRPQPHAVVGGRLFVAKYPHPTRLLERTRWASRGWTYQEAVLSRRRIAFADEVVYFECDGQASCEGVDEPLLQLLPFAVERQKEIPRPCSNSRLRRHAAYLRPATAHEVDGRRRQEIDASRRRTRDLIRRGVRVPQPASNMALTLQSRVNGGLSKITTTKRRAADVWQHIAEFSKRELSFEEDRLNGMLGIFHGLEEDGRWQSQWDGGSHINVLHENGKTKPTPAAKERDEWAEVTRSRDLARKWRLKEEAALYWPSVFGEPDYRHDAWQLGERTLENSLVGNIWGIPILSSSPSDDSYSIDWTVGLLSSLCWSLTGPSPGRRCPDLFPSWSWLGWCDVVDESIGSTATRFSPRGVGDGEGAETRIRVELRSGELTEIELYGETTLNDRWNFAPLSKFLVIEGFVGDV